MKKQITIITLGILMLAGAMAMYGGESISFETNITNPVYTVTGNSSSLEGLNITFDNGNITILPALNYKPDNFTLVFFDNLTREVIKVIRRGGGSSTTKYVDRNVTVYVPEYINITETTKTVPSDFIGPLQIGTIREDATVMQNGYKIKNIALGVILGLILALLIGLLRNRRSKNERD